MNHPFNGTGVAIVTPFNSDLSVDYNSLKKLTNHIIEGGINYIVVLGTTGESATLNKDEKKEVVRTVVETVNKRVKIVLGHGGNDTLALIEDFKKLDLSGIDGILSVSPYYNKPNQEGLYQHYKMFAEECKLPIILYNVPGRTGSNMQAETTLRIARDFKHVVAIKEASGNIEQCMKIIKDKPDGFEVISGDDNLTLPLIAAGAVGVISVTAQGAPQVFSKMVNAALKGDFSSARKLHYQQFSFTEHLFADGNPGGIKTALEAKGICKPYMRPPLFEANKSVKEKIVQLSKEVN
jgi:4-hydroxy-tetrahydrodipicolinate synthase